MPDGLVDVLKVLAGVVLGGFFSFLLKRQKQAHDEWRDIVEKQGQRIAILEVKNDSLQSRIEALHVENIACLRVQERLTAQNQTQQQEIEELRAEVEVLRGKS